MIVTLEIPAATRRKFERDAKLADRAADAVSAGLGAAVAVGGEDVRESLVRGSLGLTMRHPSSGLAASVAGWMIDGGTGAVGVPAEAPAAAYARLLEKGGTIYPKNAKALAVPISDEAKKFSSPRDMPDLDLIPRKGKPSLLVRQMRSRGNLRGFELHWILVKSVTIPAFGWLSKGVVAAMPEMTDAMQDELDEYAKKW